ncbi:WapI family immunity protein [Sphingobacterium hungaricum]
MESFLLKGENGYIKVELEQVFDFPNGTSHWGGYDVKTNIEIKSGNFKVNSSFYTSTGEIYLFYNSLKEKNNLLSGQVFYKNYEENTLITLTYDDLGHIVVEGTFSEENQLSNNLDFEFHTDQSYIKYTIKELETIVNKYGGMTGIKDK